MISAHDTPAPDNGTGWYNSGTTAHATLTTGTVETIPNNTEYQFNQWSGDASGNNYANSNNILMNSAKTATAYWDTYYYLTMTTNSGMVIPGNGYHLAGNTVSIGAAAGPVLTTWNGWTGAGTGGQYTGMSNPSSVTMNSPISEAASWISTPPPPPPAGGGTSAPQQPVIMVDVLGNIQGHPVDSNGDLLSNVNQSSPDGSFTLELAAGTIPVRADGTAAYVNYSPYYHTVNPDVVIIAAGTIASAPQGASAVHAYQMTPDGLEFKVHEATIASTYTPTDVPQGKSIIWASYDAKAQKWVDLETSGYVAGGIQAPNSAAFRTAKSGYFAILAK